MAVTTDQLTVDISINVKKAISGVEKLSDSVDGLGDELKKTSKSTEKASSALTDFGASAIKLNAGLELAMKAAKSLFAVFEKSIGSFAEADEQAQKLRNTLMLMGARDVENVASAWENFASELQRTTTAEGDAVVGLVSLAKAAGLSDSMTKKLIVSSVDLAAVTGKDVNSSFQDLLGSLKGQGKALASVVPGIKSLTEEQLKAGAAIDFMAERFAGFGEAQARTFSGQVAQMSNLVGDAFEEIGRVIVEAFDLRDAGSFLKDFLVDVIDTTKRIANGFAAIKGEVALLIPILGSLVAPLAVVFGPAALVAIKTWVATFIAAKAPLILMAAKMLAIAAAVMAVAAAVDILIKNWGKLDKVFKLVVKSAESGLRFLIDMLMQVTKVVVENLGGAFAKVFSLVGITSVESAFNDLAKTVDEGIVGNLRYTAEAMDDVSDAAKEVDFGFAGDMIQKASAFLDAFNGELETTASLTNDVSGGFKEVAAVSEETKKIMIDLAKIVSDLAAKRAKESGGSQEDIIRGEMAETLKLLALKEQELVKARQLTVEAKNLLAVGREHAVVIADQALGDLRTKTLDEILEKNKELTLVLEQGQLTALEAINREQDAAFEAIDKRLKDLKKEPALHAKAIEALQTQKKIISEINAERSMGADVQGTDVAREAMEGDFKNAATLWGQYLAPSVTAAIQSFSKAAKDKSWLNMFKAGSRLASVIVEGIADGAKMVGDAIGSAIDMTMDVLSGGPLNKVADFGEQIANMPEDFLKALDRIDQLINRFLGAFPQAVDKLVSSLPVVVQKLVDSMPKIVQSIANALPKMARAIADSAPAFVGAVMDAMPALIQGMSQAFQILIEKIPAIVDTVLKKLPIIIATLFQEIPKIFRSIFKMLPSLFESLFENADELALAFVQGVLEAVDEIAIGFVDEMILGGGIERIVGSLLRSIPRVGIALGQAALRSMANGLKKLFGGKGSGGIKFPKVEIDANQATKALKGFAARLTGEASKLFSVLDMSEGIGKATKEGGPISQAATTFEDAMRDGGNYIAELFKQFIADLIAGWRWIYGNFLEPFVNMVKSAFDFLDKNIIRPFIDGLSLVFNNINDNVFKPFLATAEVVFTGIKDNFMIAWGLIKEGFDSTWASLKTIFDGAWSGLTGTWDAMMGVFDGKISLLDAVKKSFEAVFGGFVSGFDTSVGKAKEMFANADKAFKDTFQSFSDNATKIGESIWSAIKRGFEGAKDLFTGMGDHVVNAIKDGVKGIGPIIQDSIAAIDPSNVLSRAFRVDFGGQGTVEKALNIDIPFTNFARGGVVPNMVPGVAKVAGDARMNDTVAAMLSPGEVVVPRSLMADPLVKNIISGIMDGTLRQFYKVSVGGKKIADIGGGDGGINLPALPPVPPIPVIEEAINALNPAQMWEQVKTQTYDMVLRMFESNRFHTGGLVPAFAGGGEVPALLRPGEFVVNRGAVNNLGAPFMSALNSSGKAPGETTVNVELNIETTEPIDENFVRSRLMPRVKDELRRASLDGQFVLSSKGIR